MSNGPVHVERTITIEKAADELHRLWRAPQTLPWVALEFAEVQVLDNERTRWTVHAPLGQEVVWETRIIEDRPGEALCWESAPGAAIPNTGRLHFKPAPRDFGTEVTLNIGCDPPGGALGDALARLLGSAPELLVKRILRNFKSLAVTGEIPTIHHQPVARKDGRDE